MNNYVKKKIRIHCFKCKNAFSVYNGKHIHIKTEQHRAFGSPSPVDSVLLINTETMEMFQINMAGF